MQAQLNVCNMHYGDFVVWSEEGVIIERIKLDRTFYENLMTWFEKFFTYSVLPEVVGKWLTRKPVADIDGVVCNQITNLEPSKHYAMTEEDPDVLWCYWSLAMEK